MLHYMYSVEYSYSY
jgi:hypothetical protein